MPTTRQILSDTPLFKGLSPDQIEEVGAIAVERNYGRGESIFMEGDEADGFYIVADGQVKIYKTSLEGKEQILHIYGPGNPFGEVPVFSGSRFPANALALVKSRILFLPRKAFVALITQNPTLALDMMAVLAQRLHHFTDMIEQLSLREVPERLASYFLFCRVENSGRVELELDVTKTQLASFLGTIPETLSRVLARMA